MPVGIPSGLGRDDCGGHLARDGEDEAGVGPVSDEDASGFVV